MLQVEINTEDAQIAKIEKKKMKNGKDSVERRENLYSGLLSRNNRREQISET